MPSPFKVAVIISTYNRAQLVGDAIESFVRQIPVSNGDYRCVVVDDGSRDQTVEYLEGRFHLVAKSETLYQNTSKTVSVIRQENRERGYSRNQGVKFAIQEFQSDWLLISDSDDILVDDTLKQFADRIANTQFSTPNLVVNAGQILWDGVTATQYLNPDSTRPLERILELDKRILKREMSGVGATLISRPAFEQAEGYRERRDLSGSEDWNLLFRLSLFSDFYISPHKSFFYRRHDGNTQARQFERSIQTSIIECERDLLARGHGASRIQQMRGFCLLKIAGTFNSAREFRMAAYYLFYTLKTTPHVIVTWNFWRVALSTLSRTLKSRLGWLREPAASS